MTFWPDSWSAILRPDAPVAELFVRATAIYLFLFVLMRVAGRRLLARFSMSDILVVFLLAVAVREGITGGHRSVGDAAILAVVILAWDLVIDRLAFHVKPLRNLLRHDPTRIIEHGDLLIDNARALLLTRAEITAKLHEQGVSSYAEVEEAWLEPDGRLSVVRRD
jgi:uncharacterized membrane protein YcaP (DUF421 family)